jgi:hypothetical protein
MGEKSLPAPLSSRLREEGPRSCSPRDEVEWGKSPCPPHCPPACGRKVREAVPPETKSNGGKVPAGPEGPGGKGARQHQVESGSVNPHAWLSALVGTCPPPSDLPVGVLPPPFGRWERRPAVPPTLRAMGEMERPGLSPYLSAAATARSCQRSPSLRLSPGGRPDRGRGDR